MLFEVRPHPKSLVYPLFVSETARDREAIPSMPGQHRLPLSALPNALCEAESLGIGGVLLFGLPAEKDDSATASRREDGIVPLAVRLAKDTCPGLVVMTDVCVCAYTPHGHCGIVREGRIENDATLELLAEMALAHAQAGADIVAPSSMMDGQVWAIRGRLDRSGYSETAVMAYSAKFASAFYGPFRDAAGSPPSFGDRSSYQHSPANQRHARREIEADVEEGADILMVKPGLAYLDILREARNATNLPLAVFNVSGEYAMVKAAAERGWIDERRAVLEAMTAFRRAGADMIITYHAMEVATWLKEC
jgi:porphobilinogen synthase